MKDRYTREIINGFPYPIAAMFVKLRTDECLDPGPEPARPCSILSREDFT